MSVNNLPNVATQWNSGTTRDSPSSNSKCAHHYTIEPHSISTRVTNIHHPEGDISHHGSLDDVEYPHNAR